VNIFLDEYPMNLHDTARLMSTCNCTANITQHAYLIGWWGKAQCHTRTEGGAKNACNVTYHMQS